MSLELIDSRIKITPETDCVVESIHRLTGRDRSEIQRQWLHEMAMKHIDECNLLSQILKSKGLSGSARDE